MFEKETKTEAKNYRRISVLPLISKVIKNHNQAQNYLRRHELLDSYQSSFRANLFKDICLSQLTDMILNGAGIGKHRGIILANLQKAFDTLNHKTLLD